MPWQRVGEEVIYVLLPLDQSGPAQVFSKHDVNDGILLYCRFVAAVFNARASMALRLSLSGGGGGPSARTLATSTLSIGRGERNDWVLPDPDRHLSKTHCVISEENGRYVLTDLSTNGVYMNGARQPTARDSRVVLTDGDEFRLGDYSIVVHEVAAPPAAAPGRREGHGDDPLDIDPLDDPLGRPPDPAFAHPLQHTPVRPPDDPFDQADNAARRPADPHDDMFAGVKPAGNWAGPSQADHADAPRHAMPVHRVLQPVNPAEIDFDALIGDLSPFQPQAQPQDQPQPQPPPLPAPPPHSGLLPAQAQVASADPFAGLDDLMGTMGASAVFPPRMAYPTPLVAVMQAPVPSPAPAPAPPAAAQAASAAPHAPPSQSPDALQTAVHMFLDGAGLPHGTITGDPEAALRQVGQVFRALTEGLREVLMSRAAIKGELRVEQTLLKSHGNNALKFSLSPDDAIAALLSAVRPGYMPPLAATREAFDDIKTHELAVMAGVQTVLTSLLHRFDPETLEAKLTQGRFAGVVPAARKARLWENFCDLYKTIASEAEDDFQAVFGRAFAKAYTAQSKKD